MKKLLFSLFVTVVLISGCANTVSQQQSEDTSQTATVPSENQEDTNIEPQKDTDLSHTPVQIKESPDKYTAYIKDYVSRNCATVGYESLGGERNDYVGNGYIHLIMITETGEFPGINDDELKNYYVVAQSLEPNTEVKFTFQKDSSGEEYDNLIEWQSVDEIVLKVKKVGSNEETSNKGMTKINVSPDKYTSYVKDYVGRNLATCGYISLGGDFRDKYGQGNLKLIIVTNDGSYVDFDSENFDVLKQYVVTGQGVEPNTEIKFEFVKNNNGNEFSFTNWQSREEIELYVEQISN